MTSVYLVTGEQGETLGVYSTMRLAVEASSRFGQRYFDTIELDAMPPLKAGKYAFHVRLGEEGEDDTADYMDIREVDERSCWRGGDGHIHCHVLAEDNHAAFLIAQAIGNDLRRDEHAESAAKAIQSVEFSTTPEPRRSLLVEISRRSILNDELTPSAIGGMVSNAMQATAAKQLLKPTVILCKPCEAEAAQNRVASIWP